MKRAGGGGRTEVTKDQSSSAEQKADEILSRIKTKLSQDTSIEYTVNQLMQDARDPENLGKIFIGWQPWL